MISKKLSELPEQLEFDYNLVSIELDTSPNRLRYISSADLDDAVRKDAFDLFYNNLRQNNAVVVSFDNNADMYEYGDDALVIVLFENESTRFIIFDIQDAKKIENAIFYAKEEC